MINERPHKNLMVWKRSLELVRLVYELTDGYPREEVFGLKAQMRRAAVSVPSNIAEGLTRRSKNNKLQFLNIADASLSEIDTQLEISLMLNYVDEPRFVEIQKVMVSVEQLLGGLRRSITKQQL